MYWHTRQPISFIITKSSMNGTRTAVCASKQAFLVPHECFVAVCNKIYGTVKRVKKKNSVESSSKQTMQFRKKTWLTLRLRSVEIKTRLTRKQIKRVRLEWKHYEQHKKFHGNFAPHTRQSQFRHKKTNEIRSAYGAISEEESRDEWAFESSGRWWCWYMLWSTFFLMFFASSRFLFSLGRSRTNLKWFKSDWNI